MSVYFDELCNAMAMLADHPRAIFMGQAVEYPGTAMFGTLHRVPMAKRVEMPVAEDMQMGMAIGAALNGDLPVTIYPRWNFLLLAMSQLVLHLDKMRVMTNGETTPKVIIRTAAATDKPLDPGPQHLGDFSAWVDLMLECVSIIRIRSAGDVMDAYCHALLQPGPTILVEYMELY